MGRMGGIKKEVVEDGGEEQYEWQPVGFDGGSQQS